MSWNELKLELAVKKSLIALNYGEKLTYFQGSSGLLEWRLGRGLLARHIAEELLCRGFVEAVGPTEPPIEYCLTEAGRAALQESDREA